MTVPDSSGGGGGRYGSGGFTLVEILIVSVILGIVAVAVAPTISDALVQSRVRQAVGVVAADLSRAFTIAGRTRQPVQITFNTDSLLYRIAHQGSGVPISERRFGSESEYRLTTMDASIPILVVMPNGMAALPDGTAPGEVVVTIGAGEQTRKVFLTRTGLVQVVD